MSAVVQNNALKSNVGSRALKGGPPQSGSHTFEVQFPLKVLKPVDHSNNPLFAVNEYTVNQKTVVQDMFNKRNLNEHLNYKNTFYLNERGEIANNETNTIYDHGKVYKTNIVDAGLKAQHAEKVWKEKHITEEKRVKQSFQKTTNNVAKMRQEEARIEQEELAKHRKEVKRYFKKVQNVVGVMVGTISPQEARDRKSKIQAEESECDEMDAYQIAKEVADEEATLNNRANIRQLMGSRSAENQEKVRAEKEEQERLIALEEAQKAQIERQEEARISRYLDLRKLQKTWKIDDKEKLRETVRNEIMKDILKEEERRNFEKMATNTKRLQSIENEKKPMIKQTKKIKLEPPKATSSPKKGKKSKKKKYTFSPQKIERFDRETKDDFNKRFNFNVMALPSQKALIDPVEQHRITKDFQEMVVKSGVQHNGNLFLEGQVI